jgi:type II secretory ATPase GspE/PulE/Tfp pilus assembly ATPase PilB-like protein
MDTPAASAHHISTPEQLAAMMAQRNDARNLRLGSRLVEAGIATQAAVDAALAAQQAGRKARLGHILVAMGAAHPDDVERIIAQCYGTPVVDVARYPLNPAAVQKVSAATAQQVGGLPFELVDGVLFVAFADAVSWDVLNILKFASGCRQVVSLRAANPDILKRLMTRYYARPEGTKLRSAVMSEERYSAATRGDDSPGGQFRKLLAIALTNAASDIHIHPQADGTRRVLLRIDGFLREFPPLPEKVAIGLVRHLETICGMSLHGQKEAREGRLSLTQDGSPVDLRVSIMPGASGDSVVLRVLDPALFPLSVAHLGLVPAQTQALTGLISRPQGLFLVTGPTGSGKTTTLYTLLKQLHAEKHIHVATAEDPVEYRLPGINQFDTTNFAQTLKQLLRHDPDVLMVGELRDADAGVTAVNAALTGHLVLSTVHANDSVSAVHRLLSLGVPSVLMGSCLSGVMSQRLVRLRCKVCQGTGCENCHQSGYAGRRLVAELARPKASFAEALLQNVTYADILRQTDFVGGLRLDDVLVKMAESGDTDWVEIASLVADPRRLPANIRDGLGFGD